MKRLRAWASALTWWGAAEWAFDFWLPMAAVMYFAAAFIRSGQWAGLGVVIGLVTAGMAFEKHRRRQFTGETASNFEKMAGLCGSYAALCRAYREEIARLREELARLKPPSEL